MNPIKRIIYVCDHINNIGLLPTVSYFMQRLFLKKNRLIKIKYNNIKSPIYLRNKSYDIHIFYQIFIAKELDLEFKTSISSIIDLGANIGLSSIYLINKYPNSKIISIEPDRNNYNLLKKNTSNYNSIKTLQAAVFSRNCELPLFDVGEGEASYQIRDSHEVNDSKSVAKLLTSVNCFTMSSLMNQFNLKHVDFVKMDIEGAEEEVILKSDDWLQKVSCLAVEIHESMMPGISNRINNFLDDKFNSFLKGEYYVFTRK